MREPDERGRDGRAASGPAGSRSTIEDRGRGQHRGDERRDRDEVGAVQCAAPPSVDGHGPRLAATGAGARTMRPRDARQHDDDPSADDDDLRADRERRAPPRAAASMSTTEPCTSVSSSPGCTPNTTMSVASGTRVRISIGVMSVRWPPRPGEEVGHLAEDDPPVHVQQVAGREDHHERRDRRGRRVDDERPDEAQELARRSRTGRAARPTRRRRTRTPRPTPASAPRARPSSRSSGRGSARR